MDYCLGKSWLRFPSCKYYLYEFGDEYIERIFESILLMYLVILYSIQLIVVIFRICINSVVYRAYIPRASKEASKKFNLRYNLKFSQKLVHLFIINVAECNTTRSWFHHKFFLKYFLKLHETASSKKICTLPAIMQK